MKLVREHINEKFTEDSDPIHDLGIGMDELIKRFAIETTYDHRYYKEDLLYICASHGKSEFVKYLLDKGYDVHGNADRALRWASEKGHTETVKVLLNAGADVHADNDRALQWASEKGHTETVKVLLNARANMHINDDHALRWACEKGHIEVVKVLLNAGADVHANDDWALRYASKYGHTEVVKVLQDWIAKEKKNIVKESLNEKFTEDSDPIHDMGIGSKFLRLKKGDIIRVKKRIKSNGEKIDFTSKLFYNKYIGEYGVIENADKHKNILYLKIIFLNSDYYTAKLTKKYILDETYRVKYNYTYGKATIKRWEEYFEVIDSED